MSTMCRDCGAHAPKVTIPPASVSPGSSYGYCTGCLEAPECSACGRHSIADQAIIQGDKLPLCSECRSILGMTLPPAKVAKARPRKVAAVA